MGNEIDNNIQLIIQSQKDMDGDAAIAPAMALVGIYLHSISRIATALETLLAYDKAAQ